MPVLKSPIAAPLDEACILVVEDEAPVRSIIVDAIHDLNVSVVEADNADEAWEYLTRGGAVDLVFADHRLPGLMTGAQLGTLIKRRFPKLTVIIASGNFDGRGWEDPVVAKPYDPYRLAAELVSQARQAHYRP